MLSEGVTTAYGPLRGGTLRVLSWNLWWRFGPWEERLPAILGTVASLEPDIACFQEVWVDRNASPEDSLARRIEERLGAGYHHCGTHRLDLDGVLFVNAVVSRWPIRSVAVLDLPAPPTSEESRTCVRADIEVPGVELPVQVFCTHLNWRFDESHIRQEQVRAICAFVAGSPARSFPPVLCGDLNAAPDSDEVRMLTGRAAVPEPRLVFHDAWEVAGDGPGFTWSNANPFAELDLEPSRRIDYVLVGWPKAGGAGHVTACEVVGTEPVGGIVPSDHYGVLATLRV